MSSAKKVQFCEVREHKFEGMAPNGYASWKEFAESIPLYDIVNKDLLIEDDTDPFYIVLDIAVHGAVSANGLIYDESLMSELERQLPGLGGLRGHLERDSSAYPIEVVDWVGHARVGNTIYAKGYIAPGQERKAIKRIIGRGGEIRTSIDVWAYQEWVDKKAKTYRLREVDVHTIDLVGAKKAALRKYQTGNAIATRETEGTEKPMDPETNGNVNLTERLVQDLQTRLQTTEQERDTARKSLAEAEPLIQEARRYASIIGEIRVSLGYGEEVSNEELAPKVNEIYATFRRLGEMLGNSVSIEVSVSELLSARETAQQQEAERKLETAVKTYIANWVVVSEAGKSRVEKFLKSFKQAVHADMKEGENPEDVAKRVWEDTYQMISEGVIAMLGGPAVHVGSTSSHQEAGGLSDAELKKLADRHAR